MSFTSKKGPVDRPEFIFIGEHPAIDFVNTRVLDHGEPRELFRSWSDVSAWFFQAKLTGGESLKLPANAQNRALTAVIEFREAWERALAGLVPGKEIGEAFLERLNGFLALDAFRETLRRDGKKGFRIDRSPVELEGEKLALYLIARQIADLLANANLRYLRRCANTTSCVLYFYDTTKNHRRQWCSVAACGNRHKVAQFRKRRLHATK